MVARSRGVDILTQGSGNPGASNVARVLGTRWGALVFLLDAVEGSVAGGGRACPRLATRCLPVGVCGGARPHVSRHPALPRRQGCRDDGGAMVVLHPLTSLVLTAVWFVTRQLTHKASLASLAITFGLPICLAVSGRTGVGDRRRDRAVPAGAGSSHRQHQAADRTTRAVGQQPMTARTVGMLRSSTDR